MKVIVMCISGHMASRRYWTAAGRQRRVSMSLLLYITSDAPVSQTWHWRQPSSIDDRLVGIRQWIKIPANAWLHHDVSSALGDCFQPSSTIPHNNKTAPHAVALLYLSLLSWQQTCRSATAWGDSDYRWHLFSGVKNTRWRYNNERSHIRCQWHWMNEWMNEWMNDDDQPTHSLNKTTYQLL